MEPIGPKLARFEAASRQPCRFLAILGPFRPRRVLAPEGSLWQEPAACRGLLGPILTYRACCRSSVVEHSIGNGEVDSSILSGSTIQLIELLENLCAICPPTRSRKTKEPPRNHTGLLR